MNENEKKEKQVFKTGIFVDEKLCEACQNCHGFEASNANIINGIEQIAEDSVDCFIDMIKPLLIYQFINGFNCGKWKTS